MPVVASGTRVYTGWCLETHDLAASKLVIPDRERDYLFVKALVREGKVRPDVLRARFSSMDLTESERDRVEAHWARMVAESAS